MSHYTDDMVEDGMTSDRDKDVWEIATSECELAALIDEDALSKLIKEHICEAIKAFMEVAVVGIEGDTLTVFDADCTEDFVTKASLEETLIGELECHMWRDGTGRFGGIRADFDKISMTLRVLEETAKQYRDAVKNWTVEPDDHESDR